MHLFPTNFSAVLLCCEGEQTILEQSVKTQNVTNVGVSAILNHVLLLT